MFKVGDKVRVYRTNWPPKKIYVGHEYIISEVRCGSGVATTYILARDGDALTLAPHGACTHVWYDSELGLVSRSGRYPWAQSIPEIKDVIFNDPATIVFWSDNTKTVVKCQNDDVFDPEKGLAMAISKKALGNKGNYCNELKKWLPKKYLCMYCGAETTNDSWDHMCDECKNEPLDPIPVEEATDDE